MYKDESKSNTFFFSTGIITETFIIDQNKASPLDHVPTSPWQCSSFERQPCKILLTVLWAILSLVFSLPRHWHNVCFLNFLSWGQRDDSLKVQNQVNMEDAVKLSTWIRRLSSLSWCLCGWTCRKRTLSIGKLGLTWILALSLIWVSMNALKFVSPLCKKSTWKLRGRDTDFHSKVKHCYWEKQWLCWEVGMWSIEDQLYLDVWYMLLSCVGNYSCTKEKDITFLTYPHFIKFLSYKFVINLFYFFFFSWSSNFKFKAGTFMLVYFICTSSLLVRSAIGQVWKYLIYFALHPHLPHFSLKIWNLEI